MGGARQRAGSLQNEGRLYEAREGRKRKGQVLKLNEGDDRVGQRSFLQGLIHIELLKSPAQTGGVDKKY